ncbi:hypothetical protein AgCh_021897 [Apium graveolens]
MNRTKLPIRRRIGNIPQFPVGVDVAVAEVGTTNRLEGCEEISTLNDANNVDELADEIVIVGNGQNLKCVGQCADVKFTIQGHQFKSDFYVIDLHEADLVLGVEWQESLGETRINFQKSYFKFILNGNEVCLQGNHSRSLIEPLSASNLAKLSQKNECKFAATTMEYLGHVITPEGVHPDHSKIEDVTSWPAPTNLKQLRGFLVLSGYYRKFVKGYASIASPLTDLLKRDAFEWNEKVNCAFNQLKESLVRSPVLLLPDFSKPFSIETDASIFSVGIVLLQEGHPISYFSKKLCPRMQKASTYVRELFAITSAIAKWMHYLLGAKFYIYTDRKSLKNLMQQVIQTPEQQYYLTKLLGYNNKILYKPGRSNAAADALA